jgi:hypothetical protein
VADQKNTVFNAESGVSGLDITGRSWKWRIIVIGHQWSRFWVRSTIIISKRMAGKTQTSVYVISDQVSTTSELRPDSMCIWNVKPPNRLVGGRQILGIHFLYPTRCSIPSSPFHIRRIPSGKITSFLIGGPLKFEWVFVPATPAGNSWVLLMLLTPTLSL